MKKISILLTSILIFVSCSGSDKNNSNINQTVKNQPKYEKKLKRYNVKSGIIKYKTTMVGKVMGQTINGKGTEELYFKNWGATELKNEVSKKITKINIFGQKKNQIDETHNINKLDGGKSYMVDFKNKIIYLRRDPAMEIIKTFNKGDASEVGKKMLESIGGKKIGNEKFLGYDCEVWKIPNGKQWIYKGIPLKIQMNIMGLQSLSEAISADFNINVPNKYFNLPDFPIQKIDSYQDDKENKAEIKKNAKRLKNMTYEEYLNMLKKEDPQEFKNMSEKDKNASFQMMKKMTEVMGN